MSWKPIETAPEGQVILLCDGRGNRWTDLYDETGEYVNGCGLPPIWWTPLPEPPIEKSQLVEEVDWPPLKTYSPEEFILRKEDFPELSIYQPGDPCNLSFHNDKGEVGRIEFGGSKVIFTGSADESALAFVEFVARAFKARLEAERAPLQAEIEALQARINKGIVGANAFAHKDDDFCFYRCGKH